MNLNESVSSSDAPIEEVKENEEVDTKDTEQSEPPVEKTGTTSKKTETKDSEQEDAESGTEDVTGKTDGTNAPTDESGAGDSDIHFDSDLLSDLIEQGAKSETYQNMVVEKLDSIELQITCGNFILCVIAGILVSKLILGRMK